MPVWHTLPVDDQGCLTLTSWQVLQLPSGDRHLVGYCIENSEGRVSTVVREFDTGKLHAKTDSGRVYILRGRPGGDLEAAYVWERWTRINSADSWEDVTAAVWAQHSGE